MALSAIHNETIFSVGDTVRVHTKIFEAGKIRVTLFEGTVIAIKGPAETRTFTVRRIGAGSLGIERIFPLASPWIEKIEVRKKAGRGVRRAKLYYLRAKIPREVEEIAKRAAKRKKQAGQKKNAGNTGLGKNR